MTPIIEAYRDILYYKTFPHLSTLATALIMGIVIMVVGAFVFKKLQRGFAEEF